MHGLVDISPSDFLFSDRILDDGLRGRRSPKSQSSYPVLAPEKATKAPESAIKLALVLGSAGT